MIKRMSGSAWSTSVWCVTTGAFVIWIISREVTWHWSWAIASISCALPSHLMVSSQPTWSVRWSFCLDWAEGFTAGMGGWGIINIVYCVATRWWGWRDVSSCGGRFIYGAAFLKWLMTRSRTPLSFFPRVQNKLRHMYLCFHDSSKTESHHTALTHSLSSSRCSRVISELLKTQREQRTVKHLDRREVMRLRLQSH